MDGNSIIFFFVFYIRENDDDNCETEDALPTLTYGYGLGRVVLNYTLHDSTPLDVFIRSLHEYQIYFGCVWCVTEKMRCFWYEWAWMSRSGRLSRCTIRFNKSTPNTDTTSIYLYFYLLFVKWTEKNLKRDTNKKYNSNRKMIEIQPTDHLSVAGISNGGKLRDENALVDRANETATCIVQMLRISFVFCQVAKMACNI